MKVVVPVLVLALLCSPSLGEKFIENKLKGTFAAYLLTDPFDNGPPAQGEQPIANRLHWTCLATFAFDGDGNVLLNALFNTQNDARHRKLSNLNGVYTIFPDGHGRMIFEEMLIVMKFHIVSLDHLVIIADSSTHSVANSDPTASGSNNVVQFEHFHGEAYRQRQSVPDRALFEEPATYLFELHPHTMFLGVQEWTEIGDITFRKDQSCEGKVFRSANPTDNANVDKNDFFLKCRWVDGTSPIVANLVAAVDSYDFPVRSFLTGFDQDPLLMADDDILNQEISPFAAKVASYIILPVTRDWSLVMAAELVSAQSIPQFESDVSLRYGKIFRQASLSDDSSSDSLASRSDSVDTDDDNDERKATRGTKKVRTDRRYKPGQNVL